MDFKNFRFGLIIRTVFLALSIFAVIYASFKNEWFVTRFVSGLISILFLIELIRYAEKYKRGLVDFLLSIKSRDFISSVSAISDKGSKHILKDAYKAILDEFQNIRIDKEIQFHFLKTIVEHIQIALLSFDESGKIEFINKTAKDLLNQQYIKNINSLKDSNTSLYNLFQKLKSNEKELIKIKINDALVHLSVYASELKIQNKSIKLISLQNIKQELEYQELESWQKLIRVLTHEIMNSVTPISSLSNAINETFEDTNGQKSELEKISNEDFRDIISSMKTIENRSKGLLKFVSSYKQLTRIPKPDFKEVNLIELLNHCQTLLKQKFNEYQINVELKYTQDTIYSFIDYDQIEQVMINLIINAIDAVKNREKPIITIDVNQINLNKHRIIVSDNGKGIDAEEIDKIFIPFYTTKKEGSGIGLSLSRQIMRLHKGNLQVKSELGKGSKFILEF